MLISLLLVLQQKILSCRWTDGEHMSAVSQLPRQIDFLNGCDLVEEMEPEGE